MNSIINKLTDKRILIFGYGREGKSTEEYIKAHVKYRSLDIFEGKKEDIVEDNYDYIIKSPGIVMLEENPKYTSQTELFLDEFAARTIGVTGTKGKSTTASMIAHVLNVCFEAEESDVKLMDESTEKGECCKKAILLGNIGKPCFDMIDEIDENTWIVFELSCHQLLHINKAPHVAVFLNLFEEHLDYYGTMDKYFGAKANIISHQAAGDYCFVGSNVPDIPHESLRSVIDGPTRKYELSILGEHNKTNAELVYRVAELVIGEGACGKILAAIYDFKGLPHRLEYFAKVDGVRYYDDSISTIPEACINAVESVANTGSVIVGGMDRGIDYDILVDFIKKTPDVLFILCYATGERIARELEEVGVKVHRNRECGGVMLTNNLDSATRIAKERTESGKACILSPAAPSYGYFKNFEERGKYFKNLVTN